MSVFAERKVAVIVGIAARDHTGELGHQYWEEPACAEVRRMGAKEADWEFDGLAVAVREVHMGIVEVSTSDAEAAVGGS